MTGNAQIDRGYLDAGRPALHAEFMATKKVSGFVTEEQRHTKRLMLRLSKLAADLLEDRSECLDANKNALVALAILKTYGDRFVGAPEAATKLEREINEGKHQRRER